MKKIAFFLFVAICLLHTACVVRTEPLRLSVDGENTRLAYGVDISITPMTGVTMGRRLITIAPEQEGLTYTLYGYFNGQIVSKTKNTVLVLNGLYLEQNGAKSALRCTAKTEIRTVDGSRNYIISSGRSYAKDGALHGKRDLVLGGSGTLYVKGSVWHGIEGDDVKIKGSGSLYVEGSRRGAALDCESLTVEPEKTFSAYFLNAKYGIKADDSVKIASGNFFLYDNDTALKAGTIALKGGLFRILGNRQLFIARKGPCDTAGAQVITEEKDDLSE